MLNHLPDVEFNRKPLESYICFSFENHLGGIKKLLRGRSTKRVLASIAKRLSEFENHEQISKLAMNAIAKEDSKSSFQCIVPGSKSDSFCITKNGELFKVRSIVGETVHAQQLKIAKDGRGKASFFTYHFSFTINRNGNFHFRRLRQ